MTINCLAESRSRYDLSRSRPEKDRLRNTATEVLCTYSDLVKPLSPPHAKATPTDQGSIFYTMMGGGEKMKICAQKIVILCYLHALCQM